MHNDITHDPGEGLSPTLERNIQALVERRLRERRAARGQEKLADAITAFTGSMIFVYLHLAVFGFWIIANLHWLPGIPAWDESFVVLAMIASVEAIFLSTFVLISQNRMSAAADKRADLDLQISLLAEHELTKVARLLTQIAERLDVQPDSKGDLEEAMPGHRPRARARQDRGDTLLSYRPADRSRVRNRLLGSST
ncbi:putative membrane protein [Bradyrhizobium sp. LB13.1]